MRFGDTAGDGQTEPGASRVSVSPSVDSVEALEHAVPVLRRDARAFVIDKHFHVS